MVDSLETNKLIDPIQPAEKPKPLFEQFWSKVIALELEDKIRASMEDSIYVGDKKDDIVASRIEHEKEFCSVVLNGLDKFMQNHDPEKSLFLWDIQGTLGINFDEFTPHDSLNYLIAFIRRKYPNLKFGVLSDLHIKGIEKIFSEPKMRIMKKYIDRDKYFSVAQSDLDSDKEFNSALKEGGVVVGDYIRIQVVSPEGKKGYHSFTTPTHDYENLLKSLGDELTQQEKETIRKIDPQDRKKKISDLFKKQGHDVFAVDDLPWAQNSGYGILAPNMTENFRLYI